MLSRHLWLQRPVALQPMVGGLDKKKKKNYFGMGNHIASSSNYGMGGKRNVRISLGRHTTVICKYG